MPTANKNFWGAFSPGWNFDVSSLMVLVNEGEELRYRLSYQHLVQAVAAAPVVGLQTHLRSYDFPLDPGSLTYVSPYGCKAAPLRNPQLENAIRLNGLLNDGVYSVFEFLPVSKIRSRMILMVLWATFTWIFFGGLIVFLVLRPDATWIGFYICVVMTAWSIILRVIEFSRVKPAIINEDNVTSPDEDVAMFILGRNHSAFILCGSRINLKTWTSSGPIYRDDSSMLLSKQTLQIITSAGSLIVLLFIFTAVPNGSTMDQLAFILLNLLGQANTLIGQHLNSKRCLDRLKKVDEQKVKDRTDVMLYFLGNLRSQVTRTGRRLWVYSRRQIDGESGKRRLW
ncbi:hypothetical protein V491_01069 [Pseudogymnoascus sp. VKM F-3775]|nr:hypothetical protein V491_01069 [Pseudogymnoascus sp. VKM F-3775]